MICHRNEVVEAAFAGEAGGEVRQGAGLGLGVASEGGEGDGEGVDGGDRGRWCSGQKERPGGPVVVIGRR